MFFVGKGKIKVVLPSIATSQSKPAINLFNGIRSLSRAMTLSRQKGPDYDSKGRMNESCKWLAEASLWTPWVHTCTVKAASTCDVMSIDAQKFATVVSEEVTFWPQCCEYAHSFVGWLNNQGEPCLHGMLDLGPPMAILNAHAEKASVVEVDTMNSIGKAAISVAKVAGAKVNSIVQNQHA